MSARVILCQPVYGHVPPAAHLSQMEFILHAGTHGNLHGMVHARDTYIDWGRNYTVGLAARTFPDYTHLMWLDGDICPPVDTLDRLLTHDVDAVGALYLKKGLPCDPVAYDWVRNDHGLFNSDYSRTSELDLTTGELYEVGGLGLGCTLIHRRVFETIEEKMMPGVWFQTSLSYGEDVWFFHWAHQLGFRSFLDTSLRCGHVGDYEYTLTDWKSSRE